MWVPIDPTPLDRSKQNFTHSITLLWNPQVQKLAEVDLLGTSPRMGEIQRFCVFFFSSNSPTAQTKGLTYAKYIPGDVVWAKDVPFGISTWKMLTREVPQTAPLLVTGIGISGLNVESNNYRTARPILVICRLVMQLREKFRLSTNWQKSACREYLRKLPSDSFQAIMFHSITFKWHNRFTQAVTPSMQLACGIWHKVNRCQHLSLVVQFSRNIPQKEFPIQKSRCGNNFQTDINRRGTS
jgi:hypothetical protein